MRLLILLGCGLTLAACGDDSMTDAGSTRDATVGMDAAARDGGSVDAGPDRTDSGATDSGAADSGAADSGAADSGATDSGTADSGAADSGVGGACAPMDVREGTPCGPTERPAARWRWTGTTCELVGWCRCLGADCDRLFDTEGACQAAFAVCASECRSDSDCTRGAQWCEGGRCVECDNSGLLCDISCSPRGWNTYTRNGCSPCDCGPPSQCQKDDDCSSGSRCYAGEFCWCADGGRAPECCLGNICSPAGCPDPPPTGCAIRGCARGDACVVGGIGGCTSSSCGCGDSGFWACTRDCGGGSCTSP